MKVVEAVRAGGKRPGVNQKQATRWLGAMLYSAPSSLSTNAGYELCYAQLHVAFLQEPAAALNPSPKKNLTPETQTPNAKPKFRTTRV